MSATSTGAKPAFRLSGDLAPIQAEITKRHDESIQRLQEWIKHPAIAAEDRAMSEGCDLMMKMARDAGFQTAKRIDTDGHPAVFATLDAGAPKTFGLYYMYDVKQADPAEWSSPPFEARIVDKPGFGKVVMGRGAVNQKGPEAAFLAALHAIRGAGKKLPINLVLVAEGEEEIGSPHIRQVTDSPEAQAGLKKTVGVVMPAAWQDPDGNVTVYLGAKGVVECELIADGAKWGRGPGIDVHSSNRARLDSPAFHLVQALATLVDDKGNPAIDGFGKEARPATAEQKKMLDAAATTLSEETAKKLMHVKKWANDVSWRDSFDPFMFRPTVNIEGLVAGYTGPGGKTILPHRAVAKLDLRLVPDMTYKGALEQLRAHLDKRGFGDIDIKPSGGYDPTDTPLDASLIQAQLTVLKQAGIAPAVMPRLAGSYPGYAFTSAPLRLPAGHFGFGHGSGAHAPDEYFVIEPTSPRVADWDGAVASHVAYLFALASS
ncbi:MAG TPA: M20/M25/M40 family metallo-hydrolase [Candidatus Acidoferrales bacterium]|nr:M20/M25/M40 family metallo-hydrolase [Candidatus Acidoferrales bacterium]